MDNLGLWEFSALLLPFKRAADAVGEFTEKILDDAQKTIYRTYANAKEKVLALYELSLMVIKTSLEKLSEWGGPCGSGALSILVPEKLPVIDTVSNPEVQFTIKMVDFSDCCTAHDTCYVDGCTTTRNCNDKIRYRKKQSCDDKRGECMNKQFNAIIDDKLLGIIQGLIYSSIYETAVEKFGQDAYDNACD